MQVDFRDSDQIERLAIDAKEEQLRVESLPESTAGGVRLGLLNELIPLLEELAEATRDRT